MAKARDIPGLDCGAGAGEGLRLVLLTRLEEMCAYREAALDWGDPEGVHDMRVASRRLRSAVRDFSPYLRKRKLRHAKDDLKAVADALGAVRDQDVAIAALERLASEAPADAVAGVERFAGERRAVRARARARLEEALAPDSLSELQEEFAAALANALKGPARRKGYEEREGPAEGIAFRRMGREVILARLRELRELSESLYRPFKTGPLHRMRIAAKRLRYALELFAQCWGEDLSSFAKEIARLQTSLGELHDCDEWMGEIGAALLDEKLEAGGGVGAGEESRAANRAGAAWLLGHFVRERAGHFQDALARWHEWETTGFRERLVEALDDKPPEEST